VVLVTVRGSKVVAGDVGEVESADVGGEVREGLGDGLKGMNVSGWADELRTETGVDTDVGADVENNITGPQECFTTKEIGLSVEIVVLQLVLVMTGTNWLEDSIGEVL
jgi:hypothetical protein